MLFYTNTYVFLLLSLSTTNVISYFFESSSIVYIAWFGVALYTLLKFFQYNGGDDDDDDKDKKKKMLFKFLCFSTIAALTIVTVMSWTNHSNIPIDEIISSNVDINQIKSDDVDFTHDLSQYITEDMKVDKIKWSPDFNVNNIDYEHLENYTLDELRQVIDAYDNDVIPYNKDLCNIVCDYVIDNS